jgi:hypothetical protein
VRRLVVLVMWVGGLSEAGAYEPVRDNVEAVQPRAWRKEGSIAVAPFGAWALNDPFVSRGGAGLRALWWPRPLLGLTLEGSAWGQRPSDAARTGQRELRARLRDAASGWSALAGAELSVGDGKVSFGSRIAPFEVLLRTALGLCSTTEDFRGHPTSALAAAVGARWFLGRSWALETALAWRTATLERTVDGRTAAARDTVVALELAADWRWGGGP